MTANHLMNEKVLQEEYEKSRIKLLMARLAELEGKRLLEESEALSKDPFYMPSEQETQRFVRRLNFQFKLYNLKKSASQLLSLRYQKIAIILALFVFCLLTTFFSVEAFRVRVLNLFVQVEQEYTAIRLKDNQQFREYLQIDWDHAYVPTKIPDGYRIVNVTNHQNMKVIEFQNEINGFIMFSQHHENSGISVDTEDADEVLNLKIGGHNGLFVHKDNVQTIVWQGETQLFLITANSTDLTLREMVEMAGSVSLIE